MPTLRVLLVEDSEDDALLLIRLLKQSQYEITVERVETADEMKACLDNATWEIIIADYSLPSFSGMEALGIAKRYDPDIPFIVVSGTIGEDIAVSAMKAGAQDYLMKDNLTRLLPTIERELEEAEVRRNKKQTEAALHHSEEQYRRIVETAREGIWIIKQDQTTAFVNRKMAQMLGYTVEEINGISIFAFISEADQPTVTERLQQPIRDNASNGADQLEVRLQCKDGSYIWTIMSLTPHLGPDGTYQGALVMLTDITQRKQTETALAWELEVNAALAQLSQNLIQKVSLDDISMLVLEQALRLTGAEFGYVGYIQPETGFLVCPTMTRDIWASCEVPNKDNIFEAFGGLWGWVLENQEPLLTNSLTDDERSTGTPQGHIPIRNFLSAPAIMGANLVGQIALANNPQGFRDLDLDLVKRLAALYALAVEHKRAEATRIRLAGIVESTDDAIIGKSLEGIITSWNAGAEQMYGHQAAEVVGKHISILSPPGFEDEIDAILDFIQSGQAITRYETTRARKDGTIIQVALTISPVRAADGTISGVSTISRDITERKAMENERVEKEKLRVALEKEKELSELKSRFMSIISHEFRTPLAVIGTTSELLIHYWDKLSPADREKEYSKIQAQIDHLGKLLDDVSTVTKANTGYLQFNPKPVDIRTYFQRLVEQTRATIGSRHQFRLDVADPLGDVI
ncbi:MAG: PAS domain S-box protein, partial [Chloroflexi bacterium]|nr:PAS domain S-box protein [Chloroflexota bacterium]